MAPPKGMLIQRIMAADFLGFNWMKITFHAPFNNQYPFGMSSGQQSRMWSHPRFQGNRVNRMHLNSLRIAALYAPTVVLVVLFMGMVDWYNMFQLANALAGMEIPDWAQERRAKELERAAREKPGVVLKHKVGGQVTIPGSEVLVGGPVS
jgi:hypothetical protein